MGRDVPGTFPAELKRIDNRELRALLGRLDRTPNTTRGSGAKSWSGASPIESTTSPTCFGSTRTIEAAGGDPFTAEEMRR